MTKGQDGLWMVTIPPQVVGFHYYSIVVDGAMMADPATRTFFGSGWDNSGIEIPEPDADAAYYSAKDVPHGQVSQRWYYSKVTGKWRRCYVYTPPDYESNARYRYPVLYLLHGWGENEQGWHTQGHVDFIMDNLIAEKKAKPMIIVMDNLNAVKPGEDAEPVCGSRNHCQAHRGGCRAVGRRTRRARGRPRRISHELGRRVHRDDAHRSHPHDRADLSRRARAGEPGDGRAIDGRHAILPDGPPQPRISSPTSAASAAAAAAGADSMRRLPTTASSRCRRVQ